MQRLRDLKQFETGRRFGGNKDKELARQKIRAAHIIAIERGRMMARQYKKRVKGGPPPAFKPIGEPASITDILSSKPSSSRSSTAGGRDGNATKRPAQDQKSQEKIDEKKMKLAKFGMKFQSAGTLISIGDDRIEKDTPILKNAELEVLEERVEPEAKDSKVDKVDKVESRRKALLEEKKAAYTTKWEKAGTSKAPVFPTPAPMDSAPPPVMSRQRELMEKYAENTSEDEEPDFTSKTIIKKAPTFKFKISKK